MHWQNSQIVALKQEALGLRLPCNAAKQIITVRERSRTQGDWSLCRGQRYHSVSATNRRWAQVFTQAHKSVSFPILTDANSRSSNAVTREQNLAVWRHATSDKQAEPRLGPKTLTSSARGGLGPGGERGVAWGRVWWGAVRRCEQGRSHGRSIMHRQKPIGRSSVPSAVDRRLRHRAMTSQSKPLQGSKFAF